MPHPPPPAAPRRAGTVARTVFAAAVLALSAWLLARGVAEIGWADLGRRLAALPAWAAGGTLLLLTVRFVALHLRWSPLLERLGALPPAGHRFAILMSAVLVNHVTPTARVAGGLLRGRYVSRWSGLPFSTVYGAVLLDQAAHQVVIGALTWLAFAAFAWWSGWRALAVTALALLAGAAALAARHAARPTARATAGDDGDPGAVTRLARLAAAGRRALATLRTLAGERRLRRRLALYSLLFAAATIAAQWLVFQGLGSPMPIDAVAVGVLLGAAAGTLSGTPGGLGSTEAAMVASYRALGLPAEEALAGTLLMRGLHYALVLALGVPAALYSELHRRSAGRR